MKRIQLLTALLTLIATASASAQVQSGTGTGTGTATGAGTQSLGGRAGSQVQGRAQGAGNRAAVNDALFAAAAADGGLTEVTISQLGQQKATDPELKRFSEQMIEEHTRMNAELKALAAQKGIALPQTPDFRSQFCAQSLAGLSGAEFDKCYAKAQLVVHLDSVALFEAEATRGVDRDVAALAAKALPRIQEHLKMIKPIAKRYMNEGENESEGSRQGNGTRTGRSAN